MNISCTYDETLNIVATTFSGTLSASTFGEGVKKRIELQNRHSCSRIIIDTKSAIFTFSHRHFVTLVSDLYRDLDPSIKTCHAVILPDDPDTRDVVDFFMTSGLNRGWTIKGFTSRPDALQWLGSRLITPTLSSTP